MMFGYVTVQGRGRMDDLLCDVANGLAARGVRVAGAVQRNGPNQADMPCDMDLLILTGATTIRISQSLGAHAQGCRLDPMALEDAVGQVEASLTAQTPPDILIVNKYGKQEAEGRGFRTAISAALGAGIPVLVGVQQGQMASFTAWGGDMAEPVAPGHVLDWCLAAAGTN